MRYCPFTGGTGQAPPPRRASDGSRRADRFLRPAEGSAALLAEEIGIRWLASLSKAGGAGPPLVIVHAKQMANNSDVLFAASRAFRWETMRTRWSGLWKGGAILLLWPDARMMTEVLEWSREITHLCVVGGHPGVATLLAVADEPDGASCGPTCGARRAENATASPVVVGGAAARA